MLKKRIIPCLDIKDGRTVKGVNFVELRDAGDPVELAAQYAQSGADELVFLDISATNEQRKTLVNLVHEIAKAIHIPFTVGGGISTVHDVELLLKNGADKISINSAAVYNPSLINQISGTFGNQCVVVAIDVNQVDGRWEVFTHGGKKATGFQAIDWAKEAVDRGAGEILLTTMSNDGTRKGFECAITQQIAQAAGVPVIASGGAGQMQHFADVFQQTQATGALAASVFHFGLISIPELKLFLKSNLIPIR